ncbi:MAG: glycoside hydrolase family 2 [Armatimonadetes bacterium]|nr:glycoside hydrolase family 2 [Armatimonadota bacterium]
MATMRTGQEWAPVQGHIMTRWASEVSPTNAHPEYPRPTLVREEWMSLNGLWEYAIVDRDGSWTGADGLILVPYPVESALSGVKKAVTPEQRLIYRRNLDVPAEWDGKRTILHFDAVDWEATVLVNGNAVGTHRGGYDRFSFDITDELHAGGNSIEVSVWDPTDQGTQPRGKQVLEPEGIWYTAVTGIWQSVWLEPVRESYFKGIDIQPDPHTGMVKVTADVPGMGEGDFIGLTVTYPGGQGTARQLKAGAEIELLVPSPALWTPDDPVLYKLRLWLVRDGDVIDEVDTYFAFRWIEVKEDEFGRRIYLNGEPIFQVGPLDQGWWPDGLYTAPTDDALKYDLEVLKELGFNAVRKHVKVEPERWYWWCDQMGLLVWQDMPSGDKYIGGDDPDLDRSAESAAQFELEYSEMIAQLKRHPSIVMWVPFNEGWGQYDTSRIVDLTKRLDPTRLVNSASGWTDRGVGDMYDIHRYPGPAVPPADGKRALVLGEFGGLGWPVEGHLWWDKRNWGYRTYASEEELRGHYERIFFQLNFMRGAGLCAAIYTQTTDVEGEVNGLMTYDRSVLKVKPGWAKPLHEALNGPVPVVLTVLPTSEQERQSWRVTTSEPDGYWFSRGFDDSAWTVAEGGFGARGTLAPNVGFEWTTSDIWIRREFELSSVPGGLALRIWHDEDAEVFVNGVMVASFERWVDEYIIFPLEVGKRSLFKAGKNTIAVHCRQTSGGQFIDVGLVTVVSGG